MQKLFEEYNDIIKEVSIQRYEVSGNNIKLRMKFQLRNDSQLFVRETVISGEKRKYSYHWQDRRGILIKRWDNAPDWGVETFPHHLHIGDDKVVASYTRSIEKVLEIIRQELS